MKKIIILILFLLLTDFVVAESKLVCCQNLSGTEYRWSCHEYCRDNGFSIEVWIKAFDASKCEGKPKPSCEGTAPGTPGSGTPGSGTPGSGTPGSGTQGKIKVDVEWHPTTVSVYPPGILGSAPGNYPGLVDLVKEINRLLTLTVAPLFVVILITIGGLMYLLTPFNVEEYIKKGHKYIKYAILGFIILLLTTLIFSIISALLGGPSQ